MANPIYTSNAQQQANGLNKMLIPNATPHPDAKMKRTDPRLLFQHDRDRIVWSPSFKRLAGKTQVLQLPYGDHHRQRLTHSLEVMQLSTSIARTLGLNCILTEAIALGHDLGHTPFGHSGEDALDEFLMHANLPFQSLKRFTHYEQGLDVVNYIDALGDKTKPVTSRPYLTTETQEGILKHTFKHTIIGDVEDNHKSLPFLYKHTKYNSIPQNRSGTLEAQIVRICDKLCYFISDLEDGLRFGAVSTDHLWEYDLFSKHLKTVKLPKRLQPVLSDFRIFFKIRNLVLTDLVTSLLKHSQKEIGSWDKSSLAIDMESTVAKQRRKIYKEVQETVLFKHRRVQRARRRAMHIVGCLACQLTRHPEIIPWHFRRKYQGSLTSYADKLKTIYGVSDLCETVDLNYDPWYKLRDDRLFGCRTIAYPKETQRATQISVGDIICVKDYIAGMTDSFADKTFFDVVICKAASDACVSQKWEEERWVK